MKIRILLCVLALALTYTQTTYAPAINLMLKGILIDKVQEIVIPEIMKVFQDVQIPEIGIDEWAYAAQIYESHVHIVPLSPDQLDISMDDEKNAVSIKIDNFQMQVDSKAYARALFIPAWGDASLIITIRAFAFTVSPKLRADGNANAIDFDISDFKFDIPSDGMHFEKFSVGILPDFIMRPFVNLILEVINGQFKTFENIIIEAAEKSLDVFKNIIPSSIDIPNTPFAVSLSVPELPKFQQEKTHIFMDGTIYLKSAGYNPQQRVVPALPSDDPNNDNNVQLFISEFVLNNFFQTLRDSKETLTISQRWLADLGLSQFDRTMYLSHIFPEIRCVYREDTQMKFKFGIADDLPTELKFHENRIVGKISPRIFFYVGEELAFALAFTATVDVTNTFEIRDLKTVIKGHIN